MFILTSVFRHVSILVVSDSEQASLGESMLAADCSSRSMARSLASQALKRGVQSLLNRGPKGHINIRISHSDSEAPYPGDTRNHVL